MKVKYYARLGSECTIQPGCILGLKYTKECEPVRLGSYAIVRAGTIIYADVVIGDYFSTGHNVLIREHTVIGSHVVVGTNTVIEGNVSIGNFVKIESNCYIPTYVRIGSRVFFGPNVTLTNDRYPLRRRNEYVADGPVIEDGVTLGAGAIVCPGVRIGQDSFVAAGAVVTKSVPPFSLVIGIPGQIRPLPEKLRERNMARAWKPFLERH